MREDDDPDPDKVEFRRRRVGSSKQINQIFPLYDRPYKEWPEDLKERSRASARRWLKEHPEERRAAKRQWALRKKLKKEMQDAVL